MEFNEDVSHSEYQMCSVSGLTKLTVSVNGVIISNDVTHEVARRQQCPFATTHAGQRGLVKFD